MKYFLVIAIIIFILNLLVGFYCARTPHRTTKRTILPATSGAITILFAIVLRDRYFENSFFAALAIIGILHLFPIFIAKLFSKNTK